MNRRLFLSLPILLMADDAEAKKKPKKGDLIAMKVTAYCGCAQCCGVYSKLRKTAAGTTPAHHFTAAADWSIYPVGTILAVPGIGEVMVQDKGSAIKGHRLDIFHDKHSDALKFGVKNLTCLVTSMPKG